MLTIQDWLTSSGRYPERAAEATDEIKVEASQLIEKINALLSELGIEQVSISSGFRPESVNSKIKNAAKRSAHMSGKALDLIDQDGSLKVAIAAQPEILRRLNLFMEEPSSTPTWCHLDFVNRKDRPTRTFKP